MAGFRFKPLPIALAATAALCMAPSTAFAESVEQLGVAYVEALQGYEDALDEQEQNAGEIDAIASEIEETEASIGRAQGELGETAVALYKGTRSQDVLVELLLGSESFQDAVTRYELYEKVQRRCAQRIGELEARKAEIEARVDEAKRAADEAERALLDATHSDGAQFHQVQGNGRNCGATSFIVGVNMLLHENRFTDNVEVWKGAGFNGDSTTNLAGKATAWLLANGLGNEIAVEEVPGDVRDASKLRELLDAGNVVVLSSGPDSEWQLADGTTAPEGAHSSGHWVVFYRCEGGVFFCNDSSEPADRGAGCPYTEEQMQQWLDGRSWHSATILHKK